MRRKKVVITGKEINACTSEMCIAHMVLEKVAYGMRQATARGAIIAEVEVPQMKDDSVQIIFRMEDG